MLCTTYKSHGSKPFFPMSQSVFVKIRCKFEQQLNLICMRELAPVLEFQKEFYVLNSKVMFISNSGGHGPRRDSKFGLTALEMYK